MTRQTKTPAQRAQEALDVEQRRVDRLNLKRDELATSLEQVEHDLNDAVVRRDYLAQHPDLQQHQDTTTNQAGDTTP